MQVYKEAQTEPSGRPTAAQLESINAQAKAKLTEDQVYVFSLRLCDDQPDRDMERFDTYALPALAKLFLGKTGVVDHRWSSDAQIARIFAAEVVRQDRVSFIKAWAYIRRGGAAEEVIADIEAGIKKEVSVGCSMGRKVCSICGAEYGTCGHQKGEAYDGQVCYAILQEPMDAYEFSFVAVPAQPEAGVLKGMGHARCLKELAEAFGAQAEYRLLCRQAELGKKYEAELQQEVVRLCLSLDLDVEADVLRKLASTAAAEELGVLKEALASLLRKRLPVQTQLSAPESYAPDAVESGFLI